VRQQRELGGGRKGAQANRRRPITLSHKKPESNYKPVPFDVLQALQSLGAPTCHTWACSLAQARTGSCPAVRCCGSQVAQCARLPHDGFRCWHWRALPGCCCTRGGAACPAWTSWEQAGWLHHPLLQAATCSRTRCGAKVSTRQQHRRLPACCRNQHHLQQRFQVRAH
jgi:hypothetical protein